MSQPVTLDDIFALFRESEQERKEYQRTSQQAFEQYRQTAEREMAKLRETVEQTSKQIAQTRELDCGLDAQNQIATQVYQELKEKKGSLYQKIKEGEESDFCEVSFVEPNFSHKLYDSKKEFIGIPKSAEEAYQAFSLVLEEGLGAWKEVSAAADAAKHAWVQATKGIEDSKKKKRIWRAGGINIYAIKVRRLIS